MPTEQKAIENALDVSQKGSMGFGYGQLKRAAIIAAQQYGTDWARKAPPSRDAFHLRQQLRQIVLTSIHETHSNKDVVWQRFCNYALTCKLTQVGEH